MALVDILIGIVIGVVGGVVIPAAVLYRYRHRVGRWLVGRHLEQSFEQAPGFENAFGDADSEHSFAGANAAGEPSGNADLEDPFARADATGNAPGDPGENADPGGETRRCDCGELVSPQLDEECPECGAAVPAE